MAIRVSKPPLGSQINWGHPLSQGLVGCWLMNEGGGKKIVNLAQKTEGSFVSSPVWTPSIKGKSIKFDGTDDAINLGKPNIASVLSPKSYLLICYYTTSGRSIAGCRVGSILDYDENISSALTNAVKFYHYGITTLLSQTSNETFPINSWNHLIVTWDGSVTATNVHIFIQGKEATYATQTNGVKLTTIANNSHFIGSGGSGGFFAGFISYSVFWNRVLSPSEIRQLYSAPYQFIQPIRRRFYSTGVTYRRRILVGG